MTVHLDAVSARASLREGGRAALTNVTLEHGRGVLAVIGGERDGASLLLDVIDGSAAPRAGRASVLASTPTAVRGRIARVSLDAPLPDALRVDEVCEVAADVRGRARRPAGEVLGVLGAGALARRRVRSLSVEERRVVALALALASDAEVVLVEEPLCALDPVAPRLVFAALRARGAGSCVIVTTASARDAVDLGDRLGVLTAGAYAPLTAELAHAGREPEARAVVRIVLSSAGSGALVEALGREGAVTRVEGTLDAERPGTARVVASGPELAALSRAITRRVAASGLDVELVEPEVLPVAAIRAATGATPPRASAEESRVAMFADAGAARASAEAGVIASPLVGAAPRAATSAWALARGPLARLARTTRGWLPVVGWALLGVVGALVARTSHASGADRVLRASFGPIVLPLLAYGVVSAALGGAGLRSSVRGVVALGASPPRAALAAALVATIGSAVSAALIGVLLCVIAHGPTDPPLSADLPATFGVAFVGGAAYAAYFCAGSAIGRGAMRGGFLVLDWLLGAAEGFGAVLVPRAHVASLLGGPACFELSRRVSSVALVLLAVGGLTLAVRLSRRTVR